MNATTRPQEVGLGILAHFGEFFSRQAMHDGELGGFLLRYEPVKQASEEYLLFHAEAIADVIEGGF